MQTWSVQSEKYWDKCVILKIRGSLRAQQRKTQLTSDEEWVHVHLTWQSMDRAIWVCAYGSDDELIIHVSSPTHFRAGLLSMPVIFWDHVPVWVKCTGSAKIVWSEADTANAEQRKRASRKARQLCSEYNKLLSDSPDATQAIEEEFSESLQAVIEEAQAMMGKHKPPVQTRGVYESGGDKFRITLILFQSIENWFNEQQDPKGYACVNSLYNSGEQLMGILIVYGSTHCRLEDITDSGDWNKSYQYTVAGKTIIREQGKSAKNCMSGWRKLRQSLGASVFRRLRVWSQPAAWADEVIHCWLSDLIKNEYQPQALFQVDCCSGQWTERVMHTLWLNQQVQTPVAPDTTPILQLTDTCQAFCSKRAGEKEKGSLELEMRELARRENRKYVPHFGQYEMFRVAQKMAEEGTRQQTTGDLVLRQAIKSQLVCWRPNSEIGGLQSIEAEKWAIAFPRFPPQSGVQVNWATQRNIHMHNGSPPVPPVPDWDQLEKAAIEADCFPNEPGPDDPVFDFSDDVLAELTDRDKWMLLPPQAEIPKFGIHCNLVLPCRALPCRALPCLALPCLAVPCRAVSCPAVPCRAVPSRALQ